MPIVAVATWSQVQYRPLRLLSLRASAEGVSSLSFDADDADLAAVGRAIGPARIVMLGEPDHSTAEVLAAKSRLVRYLYTHHGFDVLVLEAGFFDMPEMLRDLAAGGDRDKVARESSARVWLEPPEGQALLSFLAAASTSHRPLELAGLDPTLYGPRVRTRLRPSLEAFLNRAGLPAEKWWPSFAEDLDRLSEVRPVAVGRFGGLFRLATDPIRDREQFEMHLSQVREALASVSRADLAAEAAFWNQVLFNVGVWAAKLRSVVEAGRWDRSDPAIREEALAANLSWLAERRYPQRKLIVWAATRHLMRNGASVQPERGPAPGRLMAELRRRSMGDEVWKKFGTDTYVIAFSGYERKGGPAEGQGPQSIEAMLARAGFEVAFLDLRSPATGSGWLKGTFRSRVLGHRERTAPWSQIIDGLFFVRTMTSVQLPASGANGDG